MNTVRLEDIARKLNISVSTVSRALSGNGRVSKKTRETVLAAVRESDYTVNAVARSLRLRDAHNIGIIVPDIANSFCAAVIRGAQRICRQDDYTLMLCDSDECIEYEDRALRMLLEKQISGLILASVGGCEELIRHYVRLNIPIVFIDNIPSYADAGDVVTIDNRAAALGLTRAMIGRGFHKLGMITGPQRQSSGMLRLQGFEQALREAGIEMQKEWVLEGDFRTESGYTRMKEILRLPDRPSGMILANNNIAYGAINALRDAGLSIPQDMAVAAFDAVDETKLIRPLITTVNQPADEIGRQAAGLLIQRLKGTQETAHRQVVLETSFTDGGTW